MSIIKQAIAAAILLLGCSAWTDAKANNCSPYPYTLLNGQTADANQTMANFNSILNCGNVNLLGAANNLSDVQSPSTSRANLGLGASAVEGLGNNVIDDGSGNLLSISSLRAQVFTTTGTFTVPSYITAAAVFKITAVGGGGGGGGADGSTISAGGGGSGAYCVGWFSGMTAGQTMAVSIGAGGTAGSAAGGNGGGGGATTVSSPNSTTIMSAGGGSGGVGVTSASVAAAGIIGNCTVGVSSSGLTLAASILKGAQSGGAAAGPYFSGQGGGNPLGQGGGSVSMGQTPGGLAGSIGGGGSGASLVSGDVVGGGGGSGEVLFEWVQ